MQKSILESLNPIWPGPFFGAWARRGGEGGWGGRGGGGGEVPAARNFKPVNGIEMEFCRVAENHFFIMTS